MFTYRTVDSSDLRSAGEVIISPETLPDNIPKLSTEDLRHFHHELAQSLKEIRKFPENGAMAPTAASRIARVLTDRIRLLEREISKREHEILERAIAMRRRMTAERRATTQRVFRISRNLSRLSKITVAVAVAAVALNAAGSYLLPTLVPLRSVFEREWLRLGYIVGTLIVGALLFLFRLKFRWYYGVLEIASAAVVGWNALGNLPGGTPADVVALLGVAYLVVRGLDNCHQARAPISGIDWKRTFLRMKEAFASWKPEW